MTLIGPQESGAEGRIPAKKKRWTFDPSRAMI